MQLELRHTCIIKRPLILSHTHSHMNAATAVHTQRDTDLLLTNYSLLHYNNTLASDANVDLTTKRR